MHPSRLDTPARAANKLFCICCRTVTGVTPSDVASNLSLTPQHSSLRARFRPAARCNHAVKRARSLSASGERLTATRSTTTTTRLRSLAVMPSSTSRSN